MRRVATFLAVLSAAVVTPAWAQPATVQLETTTVFDRDAAHPGSTVLAALRFKLPPHFHVNSDQPLDEFLIPTALTVTVPAGLDAREIVYPDPVSVTTEFSEEPLSVFENEFVIGLALAIGEEVAPGSYRIQAALQHQACDNQICLAPTTHTQELRLNVVPTSTPIATIPNAFFDEIVFTGTRSPAASSGPESGAIRSVDECDVMAELTGFTTVGTAGGYLGADDFVQFIEDAETGTVDGNALQDKSAIAIIILVTLGGLALNLTPCVLPLIPINLGIIGAGVQASSSARGFILGGAYGLAMAVVYGGLGLIVILTAGSFGAINSTVWFNGAIAILFVVLALAMFDVLHIDFSKYQGRFNLLDVKRQGTLALAFGMGVITALLAGACVAPVVIQVIVYASDQYARGTTVALGLPFFLGLGMALPWPFAGAGLSFLPKPGPWMVRVKQALGVLILVFAAYYGHLAWTIHGSTRGGSDLPADRTSAELPEGWTDSICAGLDTARREDKLVLVDMWATWCKNCTAMDKTTFANARVQSRLANYVKVKFQAEDLDATPARELLEHFGGIGLPTYAILRPEPRSETP